MQIEETPQDWIQRNLHNIHLALSCFLACICEFDVIRAIWIDPTRAYDPVLKVLLPIYVLFPILFGFSCQLQIKKLLIRGQISAASVRSLRLTVSVMPTMVYGGIILWANAAFHS
jgi:hypothetical protein